MSKLFLTVRTILIGSIGGLVGHFLHLPLGFLVGAMLSTIPFAMAGVRVPTPWPLRSAMIGIVGLMAGASFTPQVFARVGEWTFSLAGVALYCTIITVIGLYVCVRIGKLDRATAAFSAAPGGLSEILVMGPAYGADLRSLSLVHGMRLVVILVIAPLIVVWAGAGAGGPARTIDLTFTMPLQDFAILAACLLFGIFGGRLARLPAAHLTGPLILSGVVHYFGLTQSNPPQLLVILAQIVIGTSVAQFFNNTSFKQIMAGLMVGGGLTTLNLGIASLFAWGFQAYLGIPFTAGLIALVPGGLPEMSLIAIALGLDPAFVSLHHLFRLILILVLLPILVPLWAPKRDLSLQH